MSNGVTSIIEARARRLWQAWVDAREAAKAEPSVDRWRAAVATLDAFKAAYDKVGRAG